MYAVCKQRFIPTGYFQTRFDRNGNLVKEEVYRADFSQHEDRLVKDMEEAKRTYGGYPVLEAIR